MTIPVPTEEQIRKAAETCGLKLSSDEINSYIKHMMPMVDSYNTVDRLPNPYPEITYKRTPGRFPAPEENEYNAWYVKTEIEGAPEGLLKGKRIAIKDNIMVAGVPMMNGASILEGYTPEIDATVVTRLLDAGATIIGKTHCENYCFSGASHTNAKGPVHNPYRKGYSSGGSSSGSGVVVALGEADMALACDQGGSIRMPASWCGLYGMKPTFGLVPYTGIMPIEVMIDHVGPLTATVTDNALMLEVIAGADGYDSRQAHHKSESYSQSLDKGIQGMKIGILKEGFGHSESEVEVDEKVRKSAALFEKLGATVEEVSIPMHLLGPKLWSPIAVSGSTQTMMVGDGYGQSRDDLYVDSLSSKLHGWELRADELSETTKIVTLFGTHIQKQFGPRFYGKAMNLRRQLTESYDKVLAEYDLLLMPTLPMKPTELPGEDCSRDTNVARAWEMMANTQPFNITHHPAMSIPCGFIDGLPVGLMLVGSHYGEATIYKAAYAFEQAESWKTM